MALGALATQADQQSDHSFAHLQSFFDYRSKIPPDETKLQARECGQIDSESRAMGVSDTCRVEAVVECAVGGGGTRWQLHNKQT